MPNAPKAKLVIKPYSPDRPDLVHLSMGFNPLANETLKARVPGVTWDGSRWVGPADMVEEITEVGRVVGLVVENRVGTPDEQLLQNNLVVEDMNPALYEYQRTGVVEILRHRRWMLNYEMGLGKTAAAIEAMRLRGVQSAIVICPAMVRLGWLTELDRWWPGHPEAVACEGRKNGAYASGPITVTSYELAARIPVPPGGWQAIVVDESHYIASAKAGRSKAVRQICDAASPSALLICLTATPITNRPWQLWHQLDTLWPRRFGPYGRFVNRYCEIGSNAYSDWIPKGLRTEFAPELERRLREVSQRATKAEWGHLLPAFIVTPIRLRAAKRAISPRELLDDLQRSDFHNAKVPERVLRDTGQVKIAAAVEWAQDHNGAGQNHLCILTHLRETAGQIASELRSSLRDVQVFHMDGDVSTSKRQKIVADCLASPAGVLVSTMHAVKEGINTMVGFDHALLAELYWSPGTMIQVLGRFHRLNGACNVDMLVIEGSAEEIISYSLRSKLKDIGKVVKRGVAEKEFTSAFARCAAETDKAFFDELRAAVAGAPKKDRYL